MDAISGADSSPFPVGLLPVFEDFGERQHGCNDTGAHSAVPKCPNMVVNHRRIHAYVSLLLCAMYTKELWGVKEGGQVRGDDDVHSVLRRCSEQVVEKGVVLGGSVGSATGSLVVGSEDSISEWAE